MIEKPEGPEMANKERGEVTLELGGEKYVLRPEFGVIVMNFAPRNLPSITPPGLAALGALLILGVGYAFRRRAR